MCAMFSPATRRKAKLRIVICSPAGYGKSWNVLQFGQTLARLNNTKIAAIDTEHGALSKYQGVTFNGMPPVEFDVCELSHFAPSAYTACIREAAANGYGVLIIDGLSHAWTGIGGALAQVDQKKAAAGGNSFVAWKDVTPQHNELIEAILGYPGHVLCTMRTKMEYVMEEENRNGRKVMVPKKVGMAPVQREGMDYEFDIVCDLDEAHTLIVGKTRCPAIDGQRVVKPGPEFLAPVIRWLDEGVDGPAPSPTFIPPTAHSGAATGGAIDGGEKATDLQVSEITIALQILQLPGQPAAMLAKRGVDALEKLTRQQADEALTNLRQKMAAKKLDLERQLGEAERAKPVTDQNPTAAAPSQTSTPTGGGSSNSAQSSTPPATPSAGTPPCGIENHPVPEDPDRIGSIHEDDQKRIVAYCQKLRIGDDDLKRILAKRIAKANPPHPVQCLPNLSWNQAGEMIENLKAALLKRFPDACPF